MTALSTQNFKRGAARPALEPSRAPTKSHSATPCRCAAAPCRFAATPAAAHSRSGRDPIKRSRATARRLQTRAVAGCEDNGLWTPQSGLTSAEMFPSDVLSATNEGQFLIEANSSPGFAAADGGGYDSHRPSTPPPDLPSLLLDSRIVYLGMPMVPAVTELIIAEILYLNYMDRYKPIFLYINSTGTTRADGEVVGFETEATAIYDCMSYIPNQVHTVGVGQAIGQACMLLSAGEKGHRYMLPNATAMLQQPKVPSTGQLQAVELYIKWKEVLRNKKTLLDILSTTTGRPIEKLDKDMLRPLYMTPTDAITYGVIDQILTPDVAAIGDVKSAAAWDKAAGIK